MSQSRTVWIFKHFFSDDQKRHYKRPKNFILYQLKMFIMFSIIKGASFFSRFWDYTMWLKYYLILIYMQNWWCMQNWWFWNNLTWLFPKKGLLTLSRETQFFKIASTECFIDLGKLKLQMFSFRLEPIFANFCYCPNCLKKWCALQMWSKSTWK